MLSSHSVVMNNALIHACQGITSHSLRFLCAWQKNRTSVVVIRRSLPSKSL